MEGFRCHGFTDAIPGFADEYSLTIGIGVLWLDTGHDPLIVADMRRRVARCDFGTTTKLNNPSR